MSNDGFPDTSPELSAETMPFMLGLGGWNALDLLGACGTNAPPLPSWCHQSVDTYVFQWPGSLSESSVELIQFASQLSGDHN